MNKKIAFSIGLLCIILIIMISLYRMNYKSVSERILEVTKVTEKYNYDIVEISKDNDELMYIIVQCSSTSTVRIEVYKENSRIIYDTNKVVMDDSFQEYIDDIFKVI